MKNLEKYLSVLDDQVDGLLLTSRYSRHYGAEFDIAEGIAVVSKKGCRYFTDSRYIESATNNIHDFEVIMTDRNRNYALLINQAIADFGIHALGYEEEYMTAGECSRFQQSLNAKMVPYNEKIRAFRDVKEEWELERLRKAQQIADAAFLEVLPRLKVGMTELEAQAELIYCMYKNGAQGLSFDPIVVSGPNTSLPHGVAGSRVIQEGDFLTMDFGVLYQGYCSDTTRTVAFGYATEEMRKVYNVVLKAQCEALAATRAGVTGKYVDGVARQVITEAGYGDYFGHGLGHSVGLFIHEEPRLSPAGNEILQPGMTVTVEPGIYLPGVGGVRIEDLTAVTENGYENFASSPKELIEI